MKNIIAFIVALLLFCIFKSSLCLGVNKEKQQDNSTFFVSDNTSMVYSSDPWSLKTVAYVPVVLYNVEFTQETIDNMTQEQLTRFGALVGILANSWIPNEFGLMMFKKLLPEYADNATVEHAIQ